ncbi:MAG: VCBS repeat-containing protein [Phycisphaeraceae bacterium]|nr:VCBS repeat-containing protein [Phycisphaeraceae bacterium]
MVSCTRWMQVVAGSCVAASFAAGAMAQSVGFSQPVTLTTGGTAVAVATADFDGDGKVDIASLNSDGTVKMHRGLGGGSFAAATALGAVPLWDPTRETPSVLLAGDVNGDGRVDLAVAGFSVPIHLILNQGNGVFGQAINTCFIGSFPPKVMLRDVNKDGRQDILLNSPGTLMISSASGFASQFVFLNGVNQNSAMAVGDFDGDGLTDLAVTKGEAPFGIRILHRNPGTTVSFTEAAFIPSQEFISDLGAADINGDAKPDLVTIKGAQNRAEVLVGLGANAFAAPVSHATGVQPRSVVLADINSDGMVDVLADTATSSAVSVLLGMGQATFAANAMFGSSPSTPAVADLNGDGVNDMAFASSGGVTVLINASAPAGEVCRADFDKDGSVLPSDIAGFINEWFSAFSAGGCR